MRNVSTRPSGIIEATVGQDLVCCFCCVEDDNMLAAELQRVYLAVLMSPFKELMLS